MSTQPLVCSVPSKALGLGLSLLRVSPVLLLASCGGGIEPTVPVVNSISIVGTPSYGRNTQVVVTGTSLDQGITVQTSTCNRNGSLLTVAPTASDARTAYFQIPCPEAVVGSITAGVFRDSSGLSLGTATYTVPTPQVTMAVGNGSNSLGSFVITLDPAKAPVTVNNFLNYVNTRFYEGVVFHRNSPNFVLQGGGFNNGLNPANPVPAVKTPNAAIVLEDNAGLSNLQWTVAMARTDLPNTATSQFFINLVNNPFLDRTSTARGFAVFGTVTAGTGVITALTAAPCVAYPALVGNGECLPFPNLVITSATQTR